MAPLTPLQSQAGILKTNLLIDNLGLRVGVSFGLNLAIDVTVVADFGASSSYPRAYF